MDATDTLVIVNAGIDAVKDNFTTVLPVLIPFIVVVLVLYFAWRKIRSLL